MPNDYARPSPSRLSNRPLYLQVRDALADRIASEDWKPSAAIPNEGDLAREYGVSSGTIRKALDLLESERLLTRRQGRGTFVNDQSSDELASRFIGVHGPDDNRLVGDVNSAEITHGVANEAERSRLSLQEGDSVYRIPRLRILDKQPFMLEKAAVPAALFPGLGKTDGLAHSIVSLAQKYGVLLGKAEERISIRMASSDAAEALSLDRGAPIALLDRIVRAIDGRPVEWRIGWCALAENYYLALMD